MPPKYVDEVVVPAIVDTFILAQCQRGNVTAEQCEREFRNLNINIEQGRINFRDRIEQLEESGHLRREGNNLTITDDGRQDVQKVLPWFRTLTERVGRLAPTGTGSPR